jgi:hypothetical protein
MEVGLDRGVNCKQSRQLPVYPTFFSLAQQCRTIIFFFFFLFFGSLTMFGSYEFPLQTKPT